MDSHPSVFERRDAAFEAASELDELSFQDDAFFDLVFQLCTFLHDADQRVRVFAARSLERVVRTPAEEPVREFVGRAFEERRECEESVFVRYWLERGLQFPRPTLEQRLWRVSTEPELIQHVPRSAKGKGWETLWTEWIETCPGPEPDWRRLRQRSGPEGIAKHRQLSKRSLEACAALLVLHYHELIEDSRKGDALAHEVLLRIDAQLQARLEWMTDVIEEDGRQDDMWLWVAIGRTLGFQTIEHVVKPNFHHHRVGGSRISYVVRDRLLPAVIHGLIHGTPRDRGQAMRLLRDFEEAAEMAAPFVIHAWGGGKATVQSRWLGFHENLYDAIAGGGIETLELASETARNDANPWRRAHACSALPRFGGLAIQYAGALEEAQADQEVEVRREAFIAHRELIPRGVERRRKEALGLARKLISSDSEERILQRDLGLKLEAALSDPDATVRAFAAYGLHSIATLGGTGYRAILRAHLKRAANYEQDPAVLFWIRLGYGRYRLDFIERAEDREFLEFHLATLITRLMDSDTEDQRAVLLLLMRYERGLELGRPFLEWVFADAAEGTK